ncbi:polypeptide N-acetylgalactosaminyltransferase 35A [Dendroctonus ponderosae]|uniref:polypeptide N-acetylgalactosaminyltransferase 35A n=1 Tax=Dendroctonus ponderosae TaxID=77166 RepID=UPI00203536CC|nr:polypeptide N-acetylgalactosaminyltransferase 35A [Dendroctonus ponderosae]
MSQFAMVSINRSFLFGIGFASLTWVISLYLYLQLTKSAENVPQKAISSDLTNLKNGTSNFKKPYTRSQFNSNDLLEKLMPVDRSDRNSSSALEQELFDLGLVRNSQEQEWRDEGFKNHAFNVLISKKLSYFRDIPDTRNALCKNLTYPTDLPKASIIICFYNEEKHTLLRSIASISSRTPENLLYEIVLVDDYSDNEDLQGLQQYLKSSSFITVKLFRTEKREGLIRARIFGARQAKGEVLIYLDSHIEVNQGWIQPLLAAIKKDKTNVVMPIIDIINPDTFVYSSSPLVRGGFNWGLHFKWDNLPKGTLDKPEDFVKPIKSPTMAGGLFAIDRQYFIDLGEYDSGMNIWGGENLEISFRIWMCGGSLHLIPCSRVGHIFRHRRPYAAPDGQDTMLYNSLRVANVWMDEYKQYFLSQNKQAAGIDFGNVSSRIQLRKELKCHDFDWYIKNVYPELSLPSDDQERLRRKWSALEHDKFQPWHSRKRNYIAEFQIKLSNTSLCIQTPKDIKTKGSVLVLRPCARNKKQLWYQTDKNELVLAQLLCLQASKPHPILYKCHELGADQEWKHKGGNNSPIYNLGAGTCLGVDKAKVDATVQMKLCVGLELNTWDLVYR